MNENDQKKRVIFNTRGTSFEVSLQSFFKFPKHTRLGKLASFQNLSSAEVLELCTDFDSSKLEFFFEREPYGLNITLDFLLTGELHLPTDNICEIQLSKELEYWMIDLGKCRRCCKTKFDIELDVKDKEIRDEIEETKKLDTLEFADVSWFPKIREKVWNLSEKPSSSNAALVCIILFN